MESGCSQNIVGGFAASLFCGADGGGLRHKTRAFLEHVAIVLAPLRAIERVQSRRAAPRGWVRGAKQVRSKCKKRDPQGGSLFVPGTRTAAAVSFHARATAPRGLKARVAFHMSLRVCSRLSALTPRGAVALEKLAPAAAAGWSSLQALTSLSTMADKQPSFATRCSREWLTMRKDCATLLPRPADRVEIIREANVRALTLAAIVAGVCFGHSAIAESASDALKGFGLVGSWSPNCAENPEDPSARVVAGKVPVRWIYATGYGSNPTLVMMTRLGNVLQTVRQEIVSAEQITSDKIKYRTVPISVKLGEQEKKVSSATFVTTVIEKVSDKITVFSQVNDDGAIYVENGISIVRMPDHGEMKEVNRIPFGTFEKCLH